MFPVEELICDVSVTTKQRLAPRWLLTLLDSGRSPENHSPDMFWKSSICCENLMLCLLFCFGLLAGCTDANDCSHSRSVRLACL